MGGRKNCANCAVIARARARTVGLGRHDLEGAAAELEALERAERGARVVVDAPLVRLVRDAVEPLRRQQQHALLLHAPLVHREDGPPGEQRLALADDALGVLDRAPHRLGLLARHRRHHLVLEQHLQVADRAGLLDRLHDRVERRPPRRAGARRPGGGADVDGCTGAADAAAGGRPRAAGGVGRLRSGYGLGDAAAGSAWFGSVQARRRGTPSGAPVRSSSSIVQSFTPAMKNLARAR